MSIGKYLPTFPTILALLFSWFNSSSKSAFFTMKVRAMWSAKTSINIYQSRRGRIQDRVSLKQRCCEKLKARNSISSLHSAGTSNVHRTVAKLWPRTYAIHVRLSHLLAENVIECNFECISLAFSHLFYPILLSSQVNSFDFHSVGRFRFQRYNFVKRTLCPAKARLYQIHYFPLSAIC